MLKLEWADLSDGKNCLSSTGRQLTQTENLILKVKKQLGGGKSLPALFLSRNTPMSCSCLLVLTSGLLWLCCLGFILVLKKGEKRPLDLPGARSYKYGVFGTFSELVFDTTRGDFSCLPICHQGRSTICVLLAQLGNQGSGRFSEVCKAYRAGENQIGYQNLHLRLVCTQKQRNSNLLL